MPRTLVIGLDSLPARLVLETWRHQLPTLRHLRESGVAGVLRSCDPPITVPAWASMLTGADPGELGLYGFHDRRDRSYHRRELPSSLRVARAPIWERAARAGKRAIVLGVPPSYPPRPQEGVLQVCDFLAPGTDVDYTAPPELAREIEAEVGEYQLDVRDYRAEDKLRIARECQAMAEQHFRVARRLMTRHPWDLFVWVEIGSDRLQHALLSHIDPSHPRHVPEGTLARLALEYFQGLDRRLGDLLELAGPDTRVLVVSDHGARPLEGGVRLNEWLRREGYLVLKEPPAAGAGLDPARVDWARTRAWGEGGYVGRIHLNLRGREPEGSVDPGERERLGAELAAGLAEIPGPDGRPVGARLLSPEDRYPACRGVPPDYWVYFGELRQRALGSFSPGPLYSEGNDRGPDEANHDFDGLLVLSGPGVPSRPGAGRFDLLDVAPTLLDALDLPGGEELRGRSLLGDIPAVA